MSTQLFVTITKNPRPANFYKKQMFNLAQSPARAQLKMKWSCRLILVVALLLVESLVGTEHRVQQETGSVCI